MTQKNLKTNPITVDVRKEKSDYIERVIATEVIRHLSDAGHYVLGNPFLYHCFDENRIPEVLKNGTHRDNGGDGLRADYDPLLILLGYGPRGVSDPYFNHNHGLAVLDAKFFRQSDKDSSRYVQSESTESVPLDALVAVFQIKTTDKQKVPTVTGDH